MKPKTMILMGLAITCGLGASYMTSRLLADRAPAEDEKVRIIVAKRTLSVGERLTKPEEMFEFKDVAKDSEPPDAIKDPEALRGKFMRQGRNKGDHITPSNLYDKDGLEIPEGGYQAVGLPVNLGTSASGFATLPGSRVDLILTVRGSDPRNSSARVLLQNVLVLAADIRVSREGDIVAPASVVTFALKEKERLDVTLAKGMGELSLTLRRLNDPTTSENAMVTGDEILTGKKAAVVAAKPAVVDTPVTPKTKTAEPDLPKVKKSYYDIVTGSESGRRTVTRVDYEQAEDGTITIVGQNTIETTRETPRGGQQSAPPSAPRKETTPNKVRKGKRNNNFPIS